MTENAGETVRETYGFACLSCGHGWEQTYRIEHRADPHGRPFVSYHEDGRQVPSPLTHPVCRNCGGHRVRVVRPDLVAAARRAASWPGARTFPPPA
ncbi:hypothetical protein [Streptomyces specialis]|uniref:hypothetical protein n=1 Tax=Streptomyces specialis TaxID=498367 RepID=UPI00073EAC3E|nr:hypothetical protein [Streptomyces specialis]